MSVPGHGVYGLRTGLRGFAELVSDSSFTKEVWVELRPVKLIEEWYIHSGTTWVAACEEVHDGVTRDVVGVLTTGPDVRLVRAESLSKCISTAGTYFYDPESASDRRRWDDGIQWWDNTSVLWDRSPLLYVHLSDGSNPNACDVVAQFGFYIGVSGEHHPRLGEELVSNGSFESGTTGWTVSGSLDYVASTAPFDSSGSAATFSVKASQGVGSFPVEQLNATAVWDFSKPYRLSAYYRTRSLSNEVIHVAVGSSSPASFVTDGGREYSASPTVCTLPPTNGEWRRFTLDFISPASGTSSIRFYIETTATSYAGYLDIDLVSLKRIWGWSFFGPRLQASSFPAVDTGSKSIFAQGRVGSGSLTVMNADRSLDTALNELAWEGQEIRAYAGGRFTDGQELTLEECRQEFTGLVQELGSDTKNFSLSFLDARAAVHRKAPKRTYSTVMYPALEDGAEGTRRPWAFGKIINITPVKIAETAQGYGKYELADTTDWTTGIKSVDAVYAYTGDATDKADPSVRATLTDGVDYSKDLSAGTITILGDVGPYEVVAGESDRLDFTIVGYNADGTVKSPLVATLTAGLYTAAGLASHVQTQLRAAIGGGDTTAVATYSDTTHKFSVGRTNANFDALLSTGANKDRSAWKLLGFTASSDKTPYIVMPRQIANESPTFTQPSKASKIGVALVDDNTSVSEFWVAVTGINQATGSSATETYKKSVNGLSWTTTNTYTSITSITTSNFAGTSTTNVDVYGIFALSDTVLNGDGATFESVDSDHLIRADIHGYVDDASGTYTGTPSGTIELAGDILKFIWRRFLGYDLSTVDDDSIVAARSTASAPLAIYLTDETTTQDVFDAIAVGSLGDIVIDGSGTLVFRPRSSDVSATAIEVTDSHVLGSIKERSSVKDIYADVLVTFGNEVGVESPVCEASDTSVALLRGRPDSRTFTTYLRDRADAQALANRLLALSTAAPVLRTLSVRSALATTKVGDKVLLTSSRVPMAGGSLDAAVHLVLGVRSAYLGGGGVTVELVEDVDV